MKLYAEIGLPTLLALALTLASCGGAGGGDARDADQGEKDNPGSKQAQGVDRGEKHESSGMPGMKEMDHGSGGMASGMLTKNGKYSDERFIDAMVPHHDGAVEMARVAVMNAEHPEIEQLAENTITMQRAEIKALESIKKQEFGTSGVPTDTSMGQMRSMGMMMDPQSLADEKPFDRAFIDSMIPHHQSAIEMAGVARDRTDNPEIEELANNIVEAQRRETSQMKQWRDRWYREG